jgi:hypothetical protein
MSRQLIEFSLDLKREDPDLDVVGHAYSECVRAHKRVFRYVVHDKPLSVRIGSVVARSGYTCVTLAGLAGDGNSSLLGVGFAKKNAVDAYDPKIGLSIATFRAMRDLRSRAQL